MTMPRFGENEPDPVSRLAALVLALLGLNLLAGAGLGCLALSVGPAVAGLGVVAWLLGLRHAFDADHIAAIDNVTRRLRQQGHRPVAIGLFFSLGHSTVVFAMTLALALGLRRTDGFAAWLGEWGVPASLLASATFLTVVGVLNAAALRKMGQVHLFRQENGSVTFSDGLFGRVGHSHAMFPLGLLFGLNLDTAAEIVLLVASATALHGLGLPVWAMLAFPLLFMAGMAAADSAEGLLMLRLYDWAMADRDRTLRLNTATTALSALLALGIAAMQWAALAHWAGWTVPSFDAVPSAAVGLGATLLMALLWAVARLRRATPAVARVS
jgi:high-affinity nickel-transport protein